MLNVVQYDMMIEHNKLCEYIIIDVKFNIMRMISYLVERF